MGHPMLFLGYLIALAFYWSACQHARKARTRRDIARSIEDILAGRTPEDAIKLDDLFMMRKEKELRGLGDKAVWTPLVDPPGRLFFRSQFWYFG